MGLAADIMDHCLIRKWPISVLTICFGAMAGVTACTDPVFATLSGAGSLGLAGAMAIDIRDERKLREAQTYSSPVKAPLP